MKINNYKKYVIWVILLTVLLIGIFITINYIEYNSYKDTFNNKILSIINLLQEKYPNLSTSEIVSILNSKDITNPNVLSQYGINLSSDSIIINQQDIFNRIIVFSSIILILNGIIIIFIIKRYNQSNKDKINEITKYIEQINQRNYQLHIEDNKEDELSILKNEIYKTTVMLNEIAYNSNQDKIDLKDSLSDISHQLKTPITSILIMLDNLIDDKDMPLEVRQDFLLDIRREINNISFLAQSILTLSKIDSNTLNFHLEDILLKDIVLESLKRLESLCDLKNIKINTTFNKHIPIRCDNKWQVEAITNIIRNGIEYSNDNSVIDILVDQNNVYSLIEIKDYGKGISKEDLPYIFNRFYKGSNSNSDSVGIGLALSKSIIEKDKGRISVDSSELETVFKIKYFK